MEGKLKLKIFAAISFCLFIQFLLLPSFLFLSALVFLLHFMVPGDGYD